MNRERVESYFKLIIRSVAASFPVAASFSTAWAEQESIELSDELQSFRTMLVQCSKFNVTF